MDEAKIRKLIGQRVRAARRARNLLQDDLGKLLQCSHGTISNIERGTITVGIPLLLRLSDALEKPLAYFLADIEEEYPQVRSLAELDYSILQTERDMQEPIAREVKALLLLQSAVKARYAGQFQEAATYAAQSKALWEAIGDQANMASALVALGDIARARDDWAEAEEHYSQALAIMESLAPHKDSVSTRRYAQTLWAYSRVAIHKGQHQEALDLLSKAREATAGDSFGLAVCGRLAGRIHLEQGETSRAMRAFTEALVHAQRANHPHGEARCLVGLARAELSAGNRDGAMRHLEEATKIARQRGFQDVLAEVERVRQEELK
ncbi:MAG TPA: XRE family transcriptional regulator [Anaerolineae bacterium]|nr:XRE family transcriptional regulator [Anaerolineae bacterium]